MMVEESVHIVFNETNLELQDVSNNNENEKDSSELLQGNNRLIQKLNRLNFSNE